MESTVHRPQCLETGEPTCWAKTTHRDREKPISKGTPNRETARDSDQHPVERRTLPKFWFLDRFSPRLALLDTAEIDRILDGVSLEPIRLLGQALKSRRPTVRPLPLL